MVPEDFKIYYLGLSKSGREAVVEKLLSLSADSSLQFSDNSKSLSCPHCKHSHIVGNGKNAKGVQRYLCRTCDKVFGNSTGKVWYHLHKKEKLSAYIHCLLAGYSIRKSAKEVEISNQTAFDWRHKLLTSFSEQTAILFSGIVESDETYFLHSEKGKKNLKRAARKRGYSATRDGINDEHVAVIVTTDRTGNKEAKVVKRGRITTKDIQATLAKKIQKDSVLCTDGHPSYAGFARRINVNHKQIIESKGQKVIEKRYHLQNVNSLDGRLKKFIGNFNGVATKYLQNYINWFLALEKVKNSTAKFTVMAAMAITSSGSWYEFKELANNHTLFST